MPGEEEVEESDDGTLEFGTTTNVDGGWGEGLPDDGLTYIGGNEQVDTGAKAIALLEELIEEDDDESSDDKLDDKEKADTSTKILGLTVKTGKDIHSGLTKGNDKSENWKTGRTRLAIDYNGEANPSQSNFTPPEFRVPRRCTHICIQLFSSAL